MTDPQERVEARVRSLAARVVEAIRAIPAPPGPATYRLTASVGYALVEAADIRLRRAKVDGKDRWNAEPVGARG